MSRRERARDQSVLFCQLCCLLALWFTVTFGPSGRLCPVYALWVNLSVHLCPKFMFFGVYLSNTLQINFWGSICHHVLQVIFLGISIPFRSILFLDLSMSFRVKCWVHLCHVGKFFVGTSALLVIFDVSLCPTGQFLSPSVPLSFFFWRLSIPNRSVFGMYLCPIGQSILGV